MRGRSKCVSLAYSVSRPLTQHRLYGGNAKLKFATDEQTDSLRPLLDLRSDVRATPTASMKRAINTVMDTHMDDDVFGECQVTKSLEKKLATLLGFSDGLFVPSGTMSNLIACTVHCNMSRYMGNEMILGSESHIYFYEQGGVSQFGGISMRTLNNQIQDGTIDLTELKHAIRPNHSLDSHFPFTKLIALENTHNRCFGSVLPFDYVRQVRQIADDYSISSSGDDTSSKRICVHMDGARFFNAHAYWLIHNENNNDSGSESNSQPNLLHSLTDGLDSMSICFSKGLGAPIGSVLLGKDEEFMSKCRRMRKAIGGAMRNPAISAICGHVALEEFITDDPKTNQLCIDARNARRLAEGLNKAAKDACIPGFSAILSQSNMVFLLLDLKSKHDGSNDDDKCFPLDDEGFVDLCDEHRIMFMPVGPGKYRVVVYHQIGQDQIDQVIDRVTTMFQGL